jgi:uncharacterized protein YceK
MKAIFLIMVLLMLMAGCATTESEPSDPHVTYGGSYRVRGGTSNGF